MAGITLSIQIAESTSYTDYKDRLKNIEGVFNKVLAIMAPIYSLINAVRYLPSFPIDNMFLIQRCR
jgi:hypothetical protein